MYGTMCGQPEVQNALTPSWERDLRDEKDDDELRQALAITVIFTAISFTSIMTAQETVQILVEKSAMFATHLNLLGIQVFSWLFLLAGFLSGAYRIYRIKQGLQSSSK